MIGICRVLFVAVVLATAVNASPAAVRDYQNIINSNPCLKKCLQIPGQLGVELSFIKRSNTSDYLLHLDSHCALIEQVRQCVSSCGLELNPFALTSASVLCEQRQRGIVDQLRPCMKAHGRDINDACIRECGDYEAMHGELRRINYELAGQSQYDATVTAGLAALSNTGCQMYKCTARCTVTKTSQACGTIADGNDAGGAVRHLFDLVMQAQRADLQSSGMVETMTAHLQPECNYQHTPDVMFDLRKDLEQVQRLAAQRRANGDIQVAPAAPKDQPRDFLRYMITEKQLQILAKAERNLDLEALKLSRDIVKSPAL